MHSVYMSDGKHPQWVFFVVCDPVEAMPPVKTLLGPLKATLSGSSYASNEGGEFNKQTFVVHWEEKDVICQVHTLVSSAVHVKKRQEVTEDFWAILAPVIGRIFFNFRSLDDRKGPATPVRTKTVN